MGDVFSDVTRLAGSRHRIEHRLAPRHRHRMPKAGVTARQPPLQVKKREVGIRMVSGSADGGEIAYVALQQGWENIRFCCACSAPLRAKSKTANNMQILCGLVRFDIQERQLLPVGIEAHCVSPNRYAGTVGSQFKPLHEFALASNRATPSRWHTTTYETGSMRHSASENGALGGDRTHNPWLRRPVLYPLSYERAAGKQPQILHPRPAQSPRPKSSVKVLRPSCSA
jgi:hypothetical protein